MLAQPQPGFELTPQPTPRYDLVVIGSSAGGFDCLCVLLASLPRNFSCPIIVVQHLHPDFKSIIASLLSRFTELPVQQAQDGAIDSGVVYMARPDFHVIVTKEGLRLNQTVAINYTRPSVDVLFESAAQSHGAKVIGVILSGAGRDGAQGIRAIKEAGGLTIAQSPESAQFRSMPECAIATGCVDRIVPLGKIAEELQQLCNR